MEPIHNMNFLDLVSSRQFLAQVAHPEEFKNHLESGPQWAYAGFDPTADSLHVGNLMPIMALRRWQQAGHNAVVLMGGATAMIGDPSGKSEMRQMLTTSVIDDRIAKLSKQFSRFLDTSPQRFRIVNNADWFRPMGYLNLLREVGADFTVNRMLAAECFKNRYEKGLSFLEFNYMILQSYDFLHLHRTANVTVQVGGDDQWSNMIGGMDLIRRKEAKKAFIVTNPLLLNSSGVKMGKTEKGAVWLDPSMTSPFELFQYFRNVDDDMVQKCLFYFTDLPPKDVERLGGLKDSSINEAKIVLATEITSLIHGEVEAHRAKEQAHSLFAKGGSKDAPSLELDFGTIGSIPLQIVELLVTTGICESKSEARRLIEQGGVFLDDVKIASIKESVSEDRIRSGNPLLIKKGKKNFYSVVITKLGDNNGK